MRRPRRRPAESAPRPAPVGGADWASPSQLTREGLLGLTRALGRGGPVLEARLERARCHRSRCRRAAARAVHPLGRLGGAAALRRQRPPADRAGRGHARQRPPRRCGLVAAAHGRLARHAPRRRIRAAGAQLLHHLRGVAAALGRPEGRFRRARGAAAGPAPEPASGFAISAIDDEPGDDLAPAGRAGHAALAGELVGESLSTWQRLDAELAGAPTPVGLLRRAGAHRFRGGRHAAQLGHGPRRARASACSSSTPTA